MAIKTIAEVFRDYEVDGVPASGPHQPNKRDIRQTLGMLESMLSQLGLGYATLALLNADLAHDAHTLASVYDDPTPANNGIYEKVGASGTGSWTRVGDLSDPIIELTVTGGTGNAILASAPFEPLQPGAKFYLMTPTANNTGATTISVNGTAAIAIKNSFNSPLAAGSLIAGSPVVMVRPDGDFRLLVSAAVDGDAILADAVAARDAAEGFADSAEASAAALGNQVHQYDTRAMAIAATIPAGVNVVRLLGYAAAGDGGTAVYKRVGSEPGHSGKFQSADGAWWEYVVEGWLNIKQFGGKGDGTTANDTARAAAYSVISSVGGTIYFPAGKYLFATKQSIAYGADPGYSLTIRGDSSHASTLYWPNDNGGLDVTAGDYRQSIHISGLSFTTGKVLTGGSAITLNGHGANLGHVPVSTITDVTTSGDDENTYGYAFAWAIGVDIKRWHYIDFIHLNTFGIYAVPGSAGHGIGVNINGDAATSVYAIVYHFQMCNFNGHDYGVIYGGWVQGVTFNQCHFGGAIGSAGIQGSGSGVLAQLNVSNCEFNCGGQQIYADGLNQTLLTINIFTVNVNGSVGVWLVNANLCSIVGNSFNLMTGTETSTTAISIQSGGNTTIVGNTISGYTTGVGLNSGTSGVIEIGNSFVGVGTKFVNNGSSQTPGVAETAHPMP